MGITNGRDVIVKNIDGDIIKEYPSITKCSEDLGITRYRLENYATNNKPYNGMYFQININPDKFKIVKCDYCGKEFTCERFKIKDGRKNYCSPECMGAARKAPDNCVCPVCGKSFHRPKGEIENANHNYCSVTCANKAKEVYMRGENNHQYGLRGKLNASFKNGVYYKNGYKFVSIDYEHPFAFTAKDGSKTFAMLEHKLVAEKYLLNEDNSVEIDGKKYLKPGFVVHHINFIRDDNRPENLMIMERGEHSKLHRTIENNFFEFRDYCKKFSLDFDTVYAQYLYNTRTYGNRKSTFTM